jgi:hypothetical protein
MSVGFLSYSLRKDGNNTFVCEDRRKSFFVLFFSTFVMESRTEAYPIIFLSF